jgi:hypothetical protein
MIPAHLERAILHGFADFRTISHAFSTFGTIDIPNNATVVITQIKWYPFLNPIKKFQADGSSATTWRDLFKYIEYQLKIDGKKSKNYLQYKNEFTWQWFGSADRGTFNGIFDPLTGAFNGSFVGVDFQLDDIINYQSEIWKNFLPIMHAPIIQDVYFVCEEYIKLTVTRNVFVEQVNTIYGLLQPPANEPPTPNGVQNVNLLQRAEMISPGGQTQFYWPAGIDDNGNDINTPRKLENYTQDIDPAFSSISDMQTSPMIFELPARFPYHSLPLVEISLVTINNNYFDKIKNQ